MGKLGGFDVVDLFSTIGVKPLIDNATRDAAPLTAGQIKGQELADRAKGEKALRDKNRRRTGRQASLFAGVNAAQSEIGKIQVGTKLG